LLTTSSSIEATIAPSKNHRIIADAGIDLGQAMQAKLATNEKRYPADQARGRHNKYTDYQPDDE
jgi:hypothetical protein